MLPPCWIKYQQIREIVRGTCPTILSCAITATAKRSSSFPNSCSQNKISPITAVQISRHTVVCRAAQEAGAQPREYIDRKKENAIFAPP